MQRRACPARGQRRRTGDGAAARRLGDPYSGASPRCDGESACASRTEGRRARRQPDRRRRGRSALRPFGTSGGHELR